jgi:hypothetical protein
VALKAVNVEAVKAPKTGSNWGEFRNRCGEIRPDRHLPLRLLLVKTMRLERK